MRTHISKSLQVRSKTIRKAVDNYNQAASAMDPPRPAVNWAKVSTYQFLEEFKLLQHTHNDLKDKRWANSGVRATVKLVRRIRRAREEITRLNVEVRRTHTAIRDEDVFFSQLLVSLDTAHVLRGAVARFVRRRRLINMQILARIRQIYMLPGFTGTPMLGIRLGSRPPGDHSTSPESLTSRTDLFDLDDERHDADEDDDIDDDTRGDVGHIVEFISELAVH